MVTELQGLDTYMEGILRDWNAPGIGIGVVRGDELVFAQGYGHRDCGSRLPFTPRTLFQIASNTKLFTAVAAGMLVEEGKLTWDKPVREAVPAIRFGNDQLDNQVTLRDMLAHRTGITRHDTIWYKSDFTRRELFERVRLMAPREPLRQTFLYNNMMYAAVGYLIELLSGSSWEEFVRERILAPLGMGGAIFSVPAMVRAEDHAVPYTERRDSSELHRIPHYEDQAGIAPAGAMITSVQEVSRWLTALMSDGCHRGVQVLPSSVLKATLEPAMPLPNTEGETRGFWEMLNCAYGMGRMTGSYRGHLLTFHGGAIGGCYSQVSYMPLQRLGVIVYVIGNHCAALTNVVGYHVYERLLGLEPTPWSERYLTVVRKAKAAGIEARAKAGQNRVPGTAPSHSLADYAGRFEHPAYGILTVAAADEGLQFDFHKTKLPLEHFHYDRFDTPDDEEEGKWSVNFLTDPQGQITKLTMSLDEAEATFVRRPPAVPTETLSRIAGVYESPDGLPFSVVIKKDGALCRVVSGEPDEVLVPMGGLRFGLARYSDVVYEFVLEGDQVTAMKAVVPSGEYVCPRR